MSAPVLQVSGLTKTFGGVQAVADVSFSVQAGETVALIGPNGAGKSTCFNMLGGQIRPEAGTVRLGNRDMTGHDAARICRAGVGRTFQIARVFGSMTVMENIQTACLFHHRRSWNLWRRTQSLAVSQAAELLARVDMTDMADEQADHLAYGDVKRLELAMALANDPALLLMDEPTAGMAPDERENLMQRVVREARAAQRAILFTEHDMDAVFSHADQVLVMDRGQLIAAGSPDEVRRDPGVQRIYLGETPEAHEATATC